MSYYIDPYEFERYSQRFKNGENSDDLLVYFQKIASFADDLATRLLALSRVSYLFLERREYNAAKMGYLTIVGYKDNPASSKVIGNSCNNLAYIYRYGLGTDVWMERAIELYRWGVKYANHEGCKRALRELGYL